MSRARSRADGAASAAGDEDLGEAGVLIERGRERGEIVGVRLDMRLERDERRDVLERGRRSRRARA